MKLRRLGAVGLFAAALSVLIPGTAQADGLHCVGEKVIRCAWVHTGQYGVQARSSIRDVPDSFDYEVNTKGVHLERWNGRSWEDWPRSGWADPDSYDDHDEVYGQQRTCPKGKTVTVRAVSPMDWGAGGGTYRSAGYRYTCQH